MKIELANLNNPDIIKSVITKRRIFSFCFLAIFLLLGLVSFPIASAAEWNVSSSNPSVGETLKIRGMASPDERIKAEVLFEKEIPVYGGRYQYSLENIKIPEGDDNQFTVQAEGVQDLHVGVKKLIWFNLQAQAANGVATISQANVPPWTYELLIDGNALKGKSAVKLKITASQTLTADQAGKFEYSYPTSSMPSGEFNIKIGGVEKTVYMKAGEYEISGEGSGSLKGSDKTTKKTAKITGISEDFPIADAIPGPDYGKYARYLLLGIISGILILFLFKKERK